MLSFVFVQVVDSRGCGPTCTEPCCITFRSPRNPSPSPTQTQVINPHPPKKSVSPYLTIYSRFFYHNTEIYWEKQNQFLNDFFFYIACSKTIFSHYSDIQRINPLSQNIELVGYFWIEKIFFNRVWWGWCGEADPSRRPLRVRAASPGECGDHLVIW